ncbi:MAG: hypothetical protein MUO57_04745 [Anaerolineales bacterium]|nr:hypothetical protein [Anaerolineales bacterium]
MENSRRNFLIIAVIVIVGCFCITAVGLGFFGYLFPFKSVTSFLSTDEPVVVVPEVASPMPSEVQADPTATTDELPLPTTVVTETAPTESSPQAPTPEPIPPDVAIQMAEIETQVIVLRNLQPVGSVSRRLLSRSELREKIESDFFEDYSPEEAQEDTIVLSALGLLNSGFDMFTFYQDLLSEQIAGQYDQKTKEMDVVQDAGFGGTERLTYAHEYTHALQDQNFDIENGLNYSSESCEQDSERCAAVQALLEGDASMLELDWFNNYATAQDLNDIQNFYQNYESPVYDNAPDFLREDFIFPYIYGQSFVEYLYNTGGWDAINGAYRELPISTEQILHPERYPDDRPLEVVIPDLLPVLGDQWQELDSGVMGEWYTYLILAHGREPSARLDDFEAQLASDGWGGDTYLVFYDENNEAVIIVLHTSWEGENDARQFYDAFQKHSTARFGSPSSLENNRIRWTHAEGVTDLSIQDQFTTWILAPDEATALLIRSAIP